MSILGKIFGGFKKRKEVSTDEIDFGETMGNVEPSVEGGVPVQDTEDFYGGERIEVSDGGWDTDDEDEPVVDDTPVSKGVIEVDAGEAEGQDVKINYNSGGLVNSERRDKEDIYRDIRLRITTEDLTLIDKLIRESVTEYELYEKVEENGLSLEVLVALDFTSEDELLAYHAVQRRKENERELVTEEREKKLKSVSEYTDDYEKEIMGLRNPNVDRIEIVDEDEVLAGESVTAETGEIPLMDREYPSHTEEPVEPPVMPPVMPPVEPPVEPLEVVEDSKVTVAEDYGMMESRRIDGSKEEESVEDLFTGGGSARNVEQVVEASLPTFQLDSSWKPEPEELEEREDEDTVDEELVVNESVEDVEPEDDMTDEIDDEDAVTAALQRLKELGITTDADDSEDESEEGSEEESEEDFGEDSKQVSVDEVVDELESDGVEPQVNGGEGGMFLDELIKPKEEVEEVGDVVLDERKVYIVAEGMEFPVIEGYSLRAVETFQDINRYITSKDNLLIITPKIPKEIISQFGSWLKGITEDNEQYRIVTLVDTPVLHEKVEMEVELTKEGLDSYYEEFPESVYGQTVAGSFKDITSLLE